MRGEESATWRDLLAAIDPSAMHRPVSLHAARMLRSHGHVQAAMSAFEDLIADDPRPEHLEEAGQLARAVRGSAQARALFERAHTARVANLGLPEAAHCEAVDFYMASDGLRDQPTRMPEELVSELFDQYSTHFEEHLLTRLNYRGHSAILTDLRQPLEARPKPTRCLDLGCGTGLLGTALADSVDEVHGVDLSARMIDDLRDRNTYDHLTVADAERFLTATAPGSWDLITAADMCPYVGRLENLLTAVEQALAPQHGLFAFTVETGRGAREPELLPTRRYAHGPEYVTRCATRAGLTLVSRRTFPLRLENERMLDGDVWVWRRNRDMGNRDMGNSDIGSGDIGSGEIR